MGLAVVTVASGGLPIVESTVGGTPVTEATNGYGVAVTKVPGKPGLPVVFETIGVVAPVTYATWDAATIANVTLSGGNLVATSTGGAVTNQGARVISASGKTSGKYYFEVTLTTLTTGGSTGVAVATTGSTYSAMGSNAATGTEVFTGSGNIWQAGTIVGGVGLGVLASGHVVGVAVELTARKAWFRLAPSGSWNATSGSAFDPGTGTGGVTVPAGTMVPLLTFNASGHVFTANFGASAFVGAVPAGFTPGWPA